MTTTVGVEEGVGVTTGFGAAGFTATPLLQTSLFPLLMQVYLNPLTVAVVFTFGQVPPLLIAAFTGAIPIKEKATTIASNLRMEKRYPNPVTPALRNPLSNYSEPRNEDQPEYP